MRNAASEVASVAHPARVPHLEGQQEPYLVPRQVVSRPETCQQALDGPDFKDALSCDHARLNVLVNQLPQISQPLVQGDTEALLGAIDIFARNVFVEHLAQQMLGATGTPPEAEWQRECKFNQSMVEERFASLDADGHSRAIDFGQDVPRQVVMKIPQTKLFAVLSWVDVAIRASRVSVPSEQTPQFVGRPKRQRLIEHLAHGARLEAVANLGGWHSDSMAQTVIDPSGPALCCEHAVDLVDRQGSHRGRRRTGRLSPIRTQPGTRAAWGCLNRRRTARRTNPPTSAESAWPHSA